MWLPINNKDRLNLPWLELSNISTDLPLLTFSNQIKFYEQLITFSFEKLPIDS